MAEHAPRQVPPEAPSCRVIAKALDFETKSEKPISLEEAQDVMEKGGFVWIDLEIGDESEGERLLGDLGVLSKDAVDRVIGRQTTSQVYRYPECVHLVLMGCNFHTGQIVTPRLDAALGEHFFLTIYRERVPFVEAMRNEYYQDFIQHAQSPSFFIYELCDFLVSAYNDVEELAEMRVREIQEELMEQVTEEVFRRMSELSRDLLRFRSVVLPARATLHELATRHSQFVSPATQPFLDNMVVALDRLLSDVLAARDILADTLSLHMSMISYRTNEVLKRLTSVSILFLPLTFLVGVYGMNFQHMPELAWRFSYGAFWVAVVVIVVGLVAVLRRRKLL